MHFGANWIHGLHPENPIFEHILKMGLNLHCTSSDNNPSDDTLLLGISAIEFANALSRYQWIKDRIEDKYDYHSKCLPHTSVLLAFESAILDSEPIFGYCGLAEKSVLNWFVDRICIDIAATPETISTASYLEGDGDYQGGEAIVKEGLQFFFMLILALYRFTLLFKIPLR